MRIPLIILFAAAAVASAEDITLIPVQDAYICDCIPDSNRNGQIFCQGQFGTCYGRSLVQFDLSELPSDGVILGAELRFYCYRWWGTASGEPLFGRITEVWDESIVTHNTAPGWSDDILATAVWPELDDWLSADVTGLVTAWYSGGVENYGFYCYSAETTGECAVGYYSSEAPYPNRLPRLIVTFSGSGIDDTSWGLLKAGD